MKKWIWLALFSCAAVQADMLDALKAYEEKNYTAAAQQFAELLPLGNELAAFNLGAMAYQGEGQQQDLVKAATYFMLAAKLGHTQATDIHEQLWQQLDELQRNSVTTQFSRLWQLVGIKPFKSDEQVAGNRVQPIKRVEPRYPVEAARRGQFGYVTLRFMVNEQGKVIAVDTLDAYPEGVFEDASVRAVKKWQYEPSDAKHLVRVQLDYSLEGGVKVAVAERVAQEHNLLRYAVAGSPHHQMALGMLLSLIETQSGNSYYHESELPLTAELDFSVFKKRATVRPDFDGFWGHAVVRVDAEGTIVEQLHSRFEDKSEVKNLLGLKLRGKIENDTYRLARSSLDKQRQVYVTASIEVPRSYSAMFWWEMAAKNGDPEAQRIMAARKNDWERYLLAQQDAEVMAWTGTRMIIDGQREQGMALLEQAIAKNYAPAKEMKQQFM